jgi:hypothetical protein
VNEFRVLAIQSDPVVLQGGETATLSVLAHHPRGVEPEFRWEWCPFRVSVSNRYECPVGVEELNALIREQARQDDPDAQVPELPADFFELGSGPQVEFAYPLSPQIIRGFCEAIVAAVAEAGENSPLASQIPVLDCDRGFEVSVRLVARAGDDEIVARKRLLLSTGDQTPINQNPQVTGVEIKLARAEDFASVRDRLPWVAESTGDEAGDAAGVWHPIVIGEPTPVVVNTPFTLRAVVDPFSVETWTPPAPEGSEREQLDPRLEVFVFRWFVSGGDLEESSSLYVDGENALVEASATDFNIPYDASKPDYDGDGVPSDSDNCPPFANANQIDSNADGIGDACDIYLWSVVRDGRLGQDYVERRVRVVGW